MTSHSDPLRSVSEAVIVMQSQKPPPHPGMPRTFTTGATRDVDKDKYDYEGFLSPLVIEAYGRYMHRNRLQQDGALRTSDNWQHGIPPSSYMQSGWRHFVDWWKIHRGLRDPCHLEDAVCGLLFNSMGYLHESLKRHHCP